MNFNLKLETQWPELLSLLLLTLGFLISISLRVPFLTYITIFLAGILSARGFYFKRYSQPILPFLILIGGFFIGYLLGSFWANRILVLFFFTLGFALSYYLHKEKSLVIFKSKSFFK